MKRKKRTNRGPANKAKKTAEQSNVRDSSRLNDAELNCKGIDSKLPYP